MKSIGSSSHSNGESHAQAGNELIVGEGVRIVGSVSAPGSVRLMGHIEGDLEAGDVHISPTGELAGTVKAQCIEICGRALHTITGTESVIIRTSARVEGDVVYASLEIEAGARIKGNLKRIETKALHETSESEARSH